MQALKSCYTSLPPLHIENEGAGEGTDSKGHADSLALGSIRRKPTLEQKGDSQIGSRKFQRNLWSEV